MAATGMTKWNASTSIVNSVTTYDETGQTITGYTFELTSGYVMVAAYADMPNAILEWADEAEPVYAEFGARQGAKVVYTGPMAYYLDYGGSTLKTLEGTQVAKSQVLNKVEDQRDVANVKPAVRSDILRMKQQAKTSGITRSAADNTSDGYITHAGDYAHNVYGGTWVCTDWANHWENSANFAVSKDLSGNTFDLCCGPTAITNAIKMYGNQYNVSAIKNRTSQSIYNTVIRVNNDANGNYYSPYWGTYNDTVAQYISECFDAVYSDVTLYGTYLLSVQNIKNATTSNRLMYILLTSNDKPYGEHHLIGYAWSLMSDNLGRNYYFIKVADGFNSSGRYLDQKVVYNESYYELYF